VIVDVAAIVIGTLIVAALAPVIGATGVTNLRTSRLELARKFG
jgi:hypothetical protein